MYSTSKKKKTFLWFIIILLAVITSCEDDDDAQEEDDNPPLGIIDTPIKINNELKFNSEQFKNDATLKLYQS